jgi:O-acetylhomoserine (thiol)-lyase
VRLPTPSKIFKRLVNISDVRSLRPPASTTSPDDARRKATAGVADLIRLSVGIEHIDDILEDLDQALAASAS